MKIKTLILACFSLTLFSATSHAKSTDTISQCSDVQAPILLKHVDQTSRDFYYLNLNQPNFICQDLVGGEQINYYRILAFAGERYTINVKSLDGEAYYSIDGDGLDFTSGSDTNTIHVLADTVWIDIEVSASTFTSVFSLSIDKQQAEEEL